MCSCSHTKWQHDVTFNVLRQKWQNRALSAFVVNEGTDESLALDLGSCRDMTSIGVVGCDCVGAA